MKYKYIFLIIYAFQFIDLFNVVEFLYFISKDDYLQVLKILNK